MRSYTDCIQQYPNGERRIDNERIKKDKKESNRNNKIEESLKIELSLNSETIKTEKYLIVNSLNIQKELYNSINIIL